MNGRFSIVQIGETIGVDELKAGRLLLLLFGATGLLLFGIFHALVWVAVHVLM
jgi:hypothetical protein